MPKNKITEMVLCALFAAVIAILSQIAVPMPGGVPVTMQTFAVALCGYFLGTLGGTVALGVYVAVGAVGAPVFANFRGGFAAFVSPSGGFIYGFIALAAICGISCRIKRGSKLNIPISLGFGILGLAACHLCGVVHFSLVMGKDLLTGFLAASAPFIIKDIISITAAYFVALALRKALVRFLPEAKKANG